MDNPILAGRTSELWSPARSSRGRPRFFSLSGARPEPDERRPRAGGGCRYAGSYSGSVMYLLYLDESGTHPSSDRLVVGGVAVFERAAYWLKRDLADTVSRFFPDEQQVPIHAPRLRTGSTRGLPEPYAGLAANERRKLLDACYSTLLVSRHPVLFATVVDKEAATSGDAYRMAFEDVVSRFDLMLARFHAANRTQRGVVIMSESSTLRQAERAAGPSISEGTQWGRTRNLSEVPLFVFKSRTRLLQAAGLVTNEVWGRYEKGIARHFDDMLPKFDREGTRLHGLTHRTAGVDACWCPACFSYRAANAASSHEGGREGARGDAPPPRRSDHQPRGPVEETPGGRDHDAPPDASPVRYPSYSPPGESPERDSDRQPESNENRAAPWDT